MIPDDQYNMFLTIWGHFGPNLAYKKILGKFTKVLGFGKTPPHVGKNSQIISFFFFESVPYFKLIMLHPLPIAKGLISMILVTSTVIVMFPIDNAAK